jgi:SAM-dependent MidA family methyltransferase
LADSSGGIFRWEALMQLALHDPEVGYYGRQVSDVGRQGDFSTAATLNSSLAYSISGWLKQEAQEVGKKLPWIEIGPGSGKLAHDVLKSSGLLQGWLQPIHLIETSSPLQIKQQQELRHRKALWHTSPESALQTCLGRAMIFTNELADAFPCRVFRKSDSHWEEWHLEWKNKVLREVWLPCQDLPESTAFHQEWETGQRVEVHESFHRWLESWLPYWKSGSLVIIDYGGDPSAIYDRRPGGTLRGYWRQERIEASGIFQRLGAQDLTADVNFADLRNCLNRADVKKIKESSLGEFCQLYAPKEKPTPGADAFRVLQIRR